MRNFTVFLVLAALLACGVDDSKQAAGISTATAIQTATVTVTATETTIATVTVTSVATVTVTATASDIDPNDADAVAARLLYVTNTMYAIKRGQSLNSMIPEARELILTLGECGDYVEITGHRDCAVKEGDADFRVEFDENGAVRGVFDITADWTQD
jgi:hypothetical protein